ncbi:stalk domain-containing protein [Paenibacillus sp. YIM B09110]|uniref:stalk domain-containing protein n=1 Tax=Paenibacillus sp. YIM B09110 TaxID=3126102 RepID=UPI00301D7B7F
MRKGFIFFLIAILLVMVNIPDAAASASTELQEDAAGKQPIPLVINNFFVLFPGEKAPFIKNNRLMVPLQPFANVIGAWVEEKQSSTSPYYKMWTSLTPEAVSGLRPGDKSAVFGGDMRLSIDVAPEFRAGELFVPVTPLLAGFGSNYELRRHWQYRMLVISDPAYRSLLPQVKDEDVQYPDYPHLLSDTAYPLIPTWLTQSQVKNSEGRPVNRLTLTLERVDGLGEKVESIELVIISVDHNGETSRWDKKLPINNDPIRTFQFETENKPSYVLVQAKPVFKEKPIYPTGFVLQVSMASVMAKFYENRGGIFDSFRLYPVDFRVDPLETILTMRKISWDNRVVTAKDMSNIVQAIYDLAGRSFPIRTIVENRSDVPYITGTISAIDQAGQILITESQEGGSSSRKLLGSPEWDLYIHGNESNVMLNRSDLKIGMKVKTWITGKPVISSEVEQAKLLEIIVD